ncbi:MAG: hypothetical protein HY897_15270 [Deltaproteobacteria bacterium]|nr:hypothetical protein [Deltaproteobacteria bacterium]
MLARLALVISFLVALALGSCQVGLTPGGAEAEDSGLPPEDSGQGGGGGGAGPDEGLSDGGGGDRGGESDGGIPVGCQTDDDCVDSAQADTPYCDTVGGQCVQCLSDGNCADGFECLDGWCNYGPKCRAEGGVCRFGDYVYPCLPGETDVEADCPGGSLCCVGGGLDGGVVDGGAAGCGEGFCRDLVFSSCGTPGYEPVPDWPCATANGNQGYCCLPWAADGGVVIDAGGPDKCAEAGGYCGPYDAPCEPGYSPVYLGCAEGRDGVCCLPVSTDAGPDPCARVGGYCTIDPECKPGYQMTQMGCASGGQPGSCCIPVAMDGGTADGGSASCIPGETREYACPDFTKVPWCECVGGTCPPVCDKIGTKSEGWYGTCDGSGLIKWDLCANCAADCREVGSYSEGWYNSCTGDLIAFGACAAGWQCIRSPENQCEFPCMDNCNCPPDRPICDQQGWGKCVPRSATACFGDSSLCPCGQVCENGQCKAGPMPCLNSCDCPIGGTLPLVCLNGACVQNKETTCEGTPCPCGNVCQNVGPTTACRPGCYENCDCPADAPFCAKDAGGTTGKCVPGGLIKCGPNGEGCPCGQVCANDKCYEGTQKCSDNCDCRDLENPICRNGVCGKPSEMWDCPCGLVCAQ